MESPLHWSAAGHSLPVGAAAVVSDRTRRAADRRTPHRVPCRVRVLAPANGPVVTMVGQTVNLSADGMAVQVNRSIPEGAAVETLVPGLSGETLYAYGKVVHARQVLTGMFEIGIRFEGE